MSLRIRRGTDTQRTGIVFDAGELIYTTNTKRLFVGDGVTSGGTDPVKPLAGNGLIYNDSTTKLDVSLATFSSDSLTEGANNKYFTNIRAQDAFGALVANGTFSGVTVQYDSVAHALNITVGGDYDAVVMDTNPQLGGNLSLNSHNIGGIGNISIAGNITANAGGTTVNTTITVAVNSGGTSSSSFTVASGTGILTNATFSSPPSNVTGQTLTVTGVVGNVVSFTPAVSFTPNMILPYSVSFTNVTGGGGSGGTVAGATVSATTVIQSPSYTGAASTNTVAVSSSNIELSNFYGVNADGTGINAPAVGVNVARGTLVAPVATQAGDALGLFQFRGYYGGQYIPAVTLRAAWDSSSVLTSSYAGGTFLVATGNNTDGFNTLTFSSKGTLAVSGAVQVGLFATGSYPTAPSKGMIIFDSTTNHFFGYNGTTWQQFA
jgi:hypothetical protein